MTVDSFKELADLFFRYAENTKNAQEDFVRFTLSYCVQEDDDAAFSDIMEELNDRVNEKLVYSYIINAHNGTNEQGLAQLVARMPVIFSEELIIAAAKMAEEEGNPDGINLNAVLMNFINNNDRESVVDYEGKVKSIIKCMNDATKLQIARIRKKDDEIQRLRACLSEQVSVERVFSEIKEPLSELERHIAVSIQAKKANTQRLIEIADDLRRKVEELYGIQPVETHDNWITQTPVKYDPEKHKLLDKSVAITENLLVYVESLGLLISTENGASQIVRADVSIAKKKRAAKTENRELDNHRDDNHKNERR